MGLGKLVKKVLGAVTKPLAKLVGDDKIEPPKPPAPPVEMPTENEATVDDTAQTESGRKKSQASGKRSLSVARSSGGGINI